MYDSGQLVDVKIPQKYRDEDDKAVLGTPVGGYMKKELYSDSKDKMAYMHVNLVLLDGQVYAMHMSSGDVISGYILTDEMNQYAIDTIFID